MLELFMLFRKDGEPKVNPEIAFDVVTNSFRAGENSANEVEEDLTTQLGDVDFDLVVNDVFSDNNELISDITKLVSDPKLFAQQALPIRDLQQDVHLTGTRSLKFTLQNYPDLVFVLSGGGIVKFERNIVINDEETKIVGRKDTFSIEKPDPNKTTEGVHQLSRWAVAENGNILGKSNSEVLGVYATGSLEEKISNTQNFASKINAPKTLQILVAGHHKEHEEFGWMLYALPRNASRATEILKFDVLTRKSLEEENYFTQFVEILFKKLRKLHSQGIVHGQLHPGNCLGVFGDDKVTDVIFTDWATTQKLSDLPTEEMLRSIGFVDGEIYDLETKNGVQSALANDFFTAIRNALLVTTNFPAIPNNKEIVIDANFFLITEENLLFQLRILAHAIIAYVQSPALPAKEKAKQVQSLYTYITSVFFKKVHEYIESEQYFKDAYAQKKNIFEMEYSNSAIRIGIHRTIEVIVSKMFDKKK